LLTTGGTIVGIVSSLSWRNGARGKTNQGGEESKAAVHHGVLEQQAPCH
jgi:hypothetical protein